MPARQTAGPVTCRRPPLPAGYLFNLFGNDWYEQIDGTQCSFRAPPGRTATATTSSLAPTGATGAASAADASAATDYSNVCRDHVRRGR